ncbi:MAG: hypothetical protein HQK57_02040 [Deltaproteobacteria bacterium]|nr:hypothetical protein [Deltaproteobacteria bacterium]MBF0507691.1 hypothetical protein [Deltaproteobacteria bacterium]
MKKIAMILTIIGLLAGIAAFVFSQNLGYGISGVHADGIKNWKCTTASPTLWYVTVPKGSAPMAVTSLSSSG